MRKKLGFTAWLVILSFIILGSPAAYLAAQNITWAETSDIPNTSQTINGDLIIGGSTGVDAALLPNLDQRLSFGRITLPHNLARVVCLEQLYRACRINAGEPYHK
jgi:23S rRNA (pseudouridine1915-N3)-methyltransferase